MKMRNAHLTFFEEQTAHYQAVRGVVPTLPILHYTMLTKSLLQKQIISILQPILQTESSDWKEISLLTKKYPAPSELNFALNQLTFLDINCGNGALLAALVRAYIQAKSALSLLFYPDGRKISQVEMRIVGEDLQCWDMRDNTLQEYYAPNPVRKVTYQHALTGRKTVIEEGKIKSETQLLQEAIFGEKKRFLQTQVYATSGDILHIDLTQQALELELSKHVYYTLESDYHELVEIPNIEQNIEYGNPLHSRFLIDMPWAVFGKKENDWENFVTFRKKANEIGDPKKQKKLRIQADKLKREMANIAVKHDERFDLLQKLQAIFHQKYELNALFEVKIGYETANEKIDLQAEIEKLKNMLGVQEQSIRPLDWALSFPELADEKGVFCGANVILSDIRPEMLPDLPKTNQKFTWKNEPYQRFCEQILTKCLLSEGYVALVLPTYFLQKNDATEIRAHLFANMDLQEIGDISPENKYLIAQNMPPFSPEIALFDTEIGEMKYVIGKKYISSQQNYVIEIALPLAEQTFIFELEKEAFLLQKVAEIVRGISISQKQIIENEGIKLLKAKDISPLNLHFQQRYMPLDFPEWLERQSEFAGGNWVYVCHFQGKIVASISESSFLFTKEVYGIKLQADISPYYVAAWLNSATFQRYVALKWGHVSTQNLLAILEKTPLKTLQIAEILIFETLVKEIIALQNGGEDAGEKWEEMESIFS